MRTWDEIVASIVKTARERAVQDLKRTEAMAITALPNRLNVIKPTFNWQDAESYIKAAEDKAVDNLVAKLHIAAFSE